MLKNRENPILKKCMSSKVPDLRKKASIIDVCESFQILSYKWLE